MKKLFFLLFVFSCANYDGTNTFEAEPISTENISSLVPYLVQGLIRLQTSTFDNETLSCEDGYIEKEYLNDTTKYNFHNCLMPLLDVNSSQSYRPNIRLYGSLSYRWFDSTPDNCQYYLNFNGENNNLISGNLIFKFEGDTTPQYPSTPQSCEIKELGANILFTINPNLPSGQTINNIHYIDVHTFNHGFICGENYYYYNNTGSLN